jgi:hypothetical protein
LTADRAAGAGGGAARNAAARAGVVWTSMMQPSTSLIASVSLLLAACGGGAPKGAIGERAGGGVTRGPVMVFVGIHAGAMFEAACHQCDGLRAAQVGQTVSSGGGTFEITGPVSDQCDASGPTYVVGYRRLTGDPETTELDIAVLPAGAPIDLVSHDDPGASAGRPEAPVRAALARLANADLTPRGLDVEAADFVLEQVLEVNVTGDARPDLLISATIPLPDDDGAGYRWSGLVVAPGGDLDAAVVAWQSDLERLVIEASFDLEGDGTRELIFDASYYEGGGRGAATLTGGALQLLGTWGCGA